MRLRHMTRLARSAIVFLLIVWPTGTWANEFTLTNARIIRGDRQPPFVGSIVIASSCPHSKSVGATSFLCLCFI